MLLCARIDFQVCYFKKIANWASKASPTLGCSIEISRDICMSVCLKETHTKKYVCQKYVGEVQDDTYAHARKQRGIFFVHFVAAAAKS